MKSSDYWRKTSISKNKLIVANRITTYNAIEIPATIVTATVTGNAIIIVSVGSLVVVIHK